MGDLTNLKLIYLKGALFLILGVACGGLIIAAHPTLTTAALLIVTIWSFARCYYFAFYVIEKYVDPAFKFSGLGSFLVYLFTRRQGGK